MRKSFGKKCLKGSLLMLFMLSGTMTFASTGYAKETYISKIQIYKGLNADQKLQKDGYEVFRQRLNMVDTSDSSDNTLSGDATIYMGFKTSNNSKDAIRDVIVDERNKSKIKVNDITYTKVANVNLNAGTKGKSLYMYSTKNPGAGECVVDFDALLYKSGEKKEYTGQVMQGDGSRTIRDSQGVAANLDKGRKGLELYLSMVSDRMIFPYLCNFQIAKGTMHEITEKFVKYGCTRYVELNKSTYIGFAGTTDASRAVTNIVVAKGKEKQITLGGVVYDCVTNRQVRDDYSLYTTTDTNAGSPIVSLLHSNSKKLDIAMPYAKWLENMYGNDSTLAGTYLQYDLGYKEAAKVQGDYIPAKLERFVEGKKKGEEDIFLVVSGEDNRQIQDMEEEEVSEDQQNAEDPSIETVPEEENKKEDKKQSEDEKEEKKEVKEKEEKEEKVSQEKIKEDSEDKEDAEEQNQETGSAFSSENEMLYIGTGLIAIVLGILISRKIRQKKKETENEE